MVAGNLSHCSSAGLFIFSFHPVYQGSGHSYKVNKLNELTQYEFRIYASNEAGDGPYSETFKFETSKAPPPVMKGWFETIKVTPLVTMSLFESFKASLLSKIGLKLPRFHPHHERLVLNFQGSTLIIERLVWNFQGYHPYQQRLARNFQGSTPIIKDWFETSKVPPPSWKIGSKLSRFHSHHQRLVWNFQGTTPIMKDWFKTSKAPLPINKRLVRNFQGSHPHHQRLVWNFQDSTPLSTDGWFEPVLFLDKKVPERMFQMHTGLKKN